MGGATSVTSAPKAANASTFERATRLWATSPTMATRSPRNTFSTSGVPLPPRASRIV